MSDPARWRLGTLALAIDAAVAVLALLAAYRLRFTGAEAAGFLTTAWPVLAAVIALQLSVAWLLGLYRRDGHAMWPVRLATAAAVGGAVGILAPVWLGANAGVSRQALAIQGAMFCLLGVMWRAFVGLRVRQARAAAISQAFGGQDLVIQGDEVGSMAGSLERTWAYRHLLFNLVAKDLKLKYQRSGLGFAWSLLNPLIMIAVYTVAFTYVMRVPTPRFSFFILIGLLSWNFFAGAVISATDAVAAQGALLRSVVFPRVVLPFSAVLYNLVQYVLTIVVFLPVMLIFHHVWPEPRMLLFPVFLLLQVTFIAGLAMVLSTAAAAFRDVRHLVDVGIGIFFWATPIIYEPTMVPEPFRQVALLAPMTSYIRAYQDIFYYGVMPDLSIWIVAAGYAVGMFIGGLSVFLAYEARMPELV